MANEEHRFPDRDRIFIVEATLLLESGGRSRYDRIVVVDLDRETQLARAVDRGMTRKDAERRMARQMSREDRAHEADYVIDNSDGPRAAQIETHRVYDALREDLEKKKRNAIEQHK